MRYYRPDRSCGHIPLTGIGWSPRVPSSFRVEQHHGTLSLARSGVSVSRVDGRSCDYDYGRVRAERRAPPLIATPDAVLDSVDDLAPGQTVRLAGRSA